MPNTFGVFATRLTYINTRAYNCGSVNFRKLLGQRRQHNLNDAIVISSSHTPRGPGPARRAHLDRAGPRCRLIYSHAPAEINIAPCTMHGACNVAEHSACVLCVINTNNEQQRNETESRATLSSIAGIDNFFNNMCKRVFAYGALAIALPTAF